MCGQISLCVNTEILEEYEEKISEKTTADIARNVVEAIARLSTTKYQESYIHFELIEQDLDDNKFVDCAIASNADYIVTNDSHFAVLKSIPWPKVIVTSINEFIQIISEDTSITN